jgi:hypothetical protein
LLRARTLKMDVLFKRMKYTIPLVLCCCVALSSCRTPHAVEEIEILEPDSDYSLCDAEQAELSLVVDFDVKGVTKRKETYHFPRVMTENDFFMPKMAGCCADGGGGGFVLSYGVWEARDTGVTYRVSCSYTVDDKRGKVEKNISTAWLEPKQEDSEEISIMLKWIKKAEQTLIRDVMLEKE